jgi:sentrin-specific protease 1
MLELPILPGKEIDTTLKNLAHFAALEGRAFNSSDWKVVLEKVPQQTNGSDCGIFTCMALESLSHGKPLDYSARDVPYMRLKMLSAFIQSHLKKSAG